MSNVQAAIGCAQLSRVEELVTKKQEILSYYISGLSELPYVAMNSNDAQNISGAWMPNVVFSKSSNVSSDHLLGLFQVNNIDARISFVLNKWFK